MQQEKKISSVFNNNRRKTNSRSVHSSLRSYTVAPSSGESGGTSHRFNCPEPWYYSNNSLLWSQWNKTGFIFLIFFSQCSSVRPLFCGESEVDQLGKIIKWASIALSHFFFSAEDVEWLLLNLFFKFQGHRLAFRGGVADWCYTVKKKLPFCRA